MLATITGCISDLQALNDLLVFYNEYWEHDWKDTLHSYSLY